MRRARWLVWAVAAVGVAGCGGSPEPSPLDLTPELEAALKAQEEVADLEERASQKRGERANPVDADQRQADREERAQRRELRAKGEK